MPARRSASTTVIASSALDGVADEREGLRRGGVGFRAEFREVQLRGERLAGDDRRQLVALLVDQREGGVAARRRLPLDPGLRVPVRERLVRRERTDDLDLRRLRLPDELTRMRPAVRV